MDKVLVTGASGFLGSHICEQFIAHKYDVGALVRRTSKVDHLSGVRLVHGDVTDAASLAEAMKGAQAVVHSAGLVVARNAAEFHAVNVAGTQNVIEAALQAKVPHLVFVSSLTVAGPSQDGGPVPADSGYNPLTNYARSKAEAEKLVLAARDSLRVTVLRPPMIYGPRDPQSLKLFMSIRARVLPLPPQGPNRMSVIYASDCAFACVRAVQSKPPSGNTYFLSDGNVYELKEMFEHAEQVLGTRAWMRFGLPMAIVAPAAAANHLVSKVLGRASMFNLDKLNELKQRHWVCDSGPAQRDLGWRPSVDWQSGARQAIDWYRSQGLL